MQPKIAPTSPAAKHDVVKRVWQDGELRQPPRVPWGGIVSLVFLLTLVLTATAVTALGWAVHRWPNSWLASIAPLTTTTTTVVQSTNDRETTTIPTNIQSILGSTFTLHQNQGEDGLYRPTDGTGYAWPLSSTGWLVTLTGAWPTGVNSLVVIPAVGQPQTVGATISDPASPFVFIKSTSINAQPLGFADAKSLQTGQPVWVLGSGTATRRQLSQINLPRWVSSDRLEATWTLDTSVAADVGAAVVDNNGRLVGLLGTDSRVWPVNGLSAAVRGVLQSGKIERPAAGFRAVDLAQTVVTGKPRAAGWLVGADDDGTAVSAKGPAEKAGLKPGDVITAIDEQSVSGDVWTFVQNAQPGDELVLTIERKGKESTVTLKLGSIRS